MNLKQKFKSLPLIVRCAVISVLYAVFLVTGQVLISGGIISNYISKIIVLSGINMILTLSLNMATGYLGQLPLGHAGFMAVGAYASAILLRAFPTDIAQIFFPLTIIFGGILAAIFGLVIGIPALRLKGDYLAIITLGFGEIIRVIITNIDSVIGRDFTYGAKTLKNIPKVTTFLSTFICVGLTVLLMYTLIHSRHGRAILAVRDNEIAAESCGIHITFYKAFGFVFSAFFAGVAGALYASYLGILNPGSFGFEKSIEILVMVVFGGMGSMIGSVVSATVLTALPELLREFSDYRMLVYSILLILIMVFGNSPKSEPFKRKLVGFVSGIFKPKHREGAENE